MVVKQIHNSRVFGSILSSGYSLSRVLHVFCMFSACLHVFPLGSLIFLPKIYLKVDWLLYIAICVNESVSVFVRVALRVCPCFMSSVS